MNNTNPSPAPSGSSSRTAKRFGINAGSSSILLIFVILCLISFATLAIVSANADHKLSLKILDRTTAYYEACNQAEASLASVDRTLAQIYAASDSEEAYFSTAGRSKSYTIPISDLQTLQISIAILYPTQENHAFYTITSWQVLTTQDLDYTSTLPVPN